MTSLKLKNLYKSYAGEVTAVNDLNLDIKDKEFLVILGPTGSGKSTILRMIAGLEEVSGGEIYIGSDLVNEVTAKDRNIAMVLQNHALYPKLTIFENISFGLKLKKMPKDIIKKRVNDAAQMLGISDLLNKRPKSLSDAQKQLVALGRAIVRQPKVILLDEPLGNLDEELRREMREEISKLHQKLNITFIYATQDQTETMSMATKVVVMKDGFIQQSGSPEDIYSKPINKFVAGFVGSPQMNFANVKISKDSSGANLVFGKNKIGLPMQKVKELEQSGYIGKEVIMGIRPEDIHNEEEFIADKNTLKANIDLIESIASETYLYMSIQGINFIQELKKSDKLKSGDSIKVAFDIDRIYLFDKDTEKAI